MARFSEENSQESGDLSRRVTLKDVAAALRVSHTTVSLALRGHSRITAERRKEVGFVTPDSVPCRWLDGYMSDWIHLPLEERVSPLLLPTAPDRPMLFSLWMNECKPDVVVIDVGEVKKWLRDLKVRVPADIGLVAMSVLDGEADAGIDQCSCDLGRAAAEVLISRINNENLGESGACREISVSGQLGGWGDGEAAAGILIPAGQYRIGTR